MNILPRLLVDAARLLCCVHEPIYIHTCVALFLNHLKTDCRLYAPLLLNIAVYFLRTRTVTYITTIQRSKSANLTLITIVGPIRSMPSFGFISSPFTIKRGRGMRSRIQSQLALCINCYVSCASFGLDQLLSLFVSFMTLTFLKSKSRVFCGVSFTLGLSDAYS